MTEMRKSLVPEELFLGTGCVYTQDPMLHCDIITFLKEHVFPLANWKTQNTVFKNKKQSINLLNKLLNQIQIYLPIQPVHKSGCIQQMHLCADCFVFPVPLHNSPFSEQPQYRPYIMACNWFPLPPPFAITILALHLFSTTISALICRQKTVAG